MSKKKRLYDELDKIRPYINGRGKAVADRAQLPMPTYHYYMRGLGSNTEIIELIIKSAKLELAELNKEIEQVL